MGWATSSNVVTTNLDSGTDSPALARGDIKAAFDELKNVIDGRATANGVASLDSNTLVPATQIPDWLKNILDINYKKFPELILPPRVD